MRVAVTGASGFVGSHTVAALTDAGHRVKAVVRNPDRLKPALEPLDVAAETIDIHVADMTDLEAIRPSLADVDAVVHCASIYSFDRRRAREIAEINDLGVRHVLNSAIEAGLDPIVHVSSMLALHRDGEVGLTIGRDAPPGNSPYSYSSSKARQETFAHSLQSSGAPVVITYPGGVIGPHDPHDGESVRMFRNAGVGKMSMLPDLTVAFVDVRDVAIVHAAVMEKGLGPQRYIAGGHTIRMDSMVELITAALGKPKRTRRVPMGAARAVGVLGDALRKIGLDIGASPEAIWLGGNHVTPDNSHTEDDLGITFRPIEESVKDQVQWMIDTNRF